MDVHSGFVSGTVNHHVGAGSALPSGFARKPESSASGLRTHGLSNVDCVTVWFFSLNVKRTVSPTAAWTELGV